MLRISSNIALMYALVSVSILVSCNSIKSPNVDVQFINSHVGWIIGPRLLQTTDGGQTWIQLRNEGDGTVEAEDILQGRNWMQFLNEKVAFSVGGSGVAKTLDGGRTWSSTVVTDGRDQSLGSLFFISAYEGWVVGDHIYRTTDGGNRWNRLCKTPSGDEATQRNMRVAPAYAINNPSLWFTSRQDGVMGRLDGEVYLTGDGGNTWNLVWKAGTSIMDLYFVSNQVGWVVGKEGLLARTIDGGQTWSIVSVPTKADLTSVFFVNKQTGYTVGYETTILYTKDGGLTWRQGVVSEELRSVPLASVAFTDENHGWAVGGRNDPTTPSVSALSNLILATNDGGQTWRRLKL